MHADATQEGVETIPERLGEGNDSSDKQSISDGSSASDHKSEVQQTWAHIRLSLGAIEDMMSSRVKKKTQNMEHEQIPMGEVHLPSIEEEGSSNASEKDFEVEVCLNALNDRVNEDTVENAVGDGVSNSVNVAVVEETVCDGFSDSVDAKENSMGGSVSDSVDAAVVEKTVGGSASDIVDADVVGKTLGDGVSNSVDTAVVEKTMGGNVSDSVDATSRPEQAVGDMVADCVNANGEEKAVADRFNDTVNVAGAEKAVDDGFTSKPCFPWREELECLVRGGVPKDLRGEV